MYPAAGMLVMAIEAAHEMADPTKTTSGFELKDCQFLRSLNIPQDSNGIEVQISLNFTSDALQTGMSWADFSLCSREWGVVRMLSWLRTRDLPSQNQRG